MNSSNTKGKFFHDFFFSLSLSLFIFLIRSPTTFSSVVRRGDGTLQRAKRDKRSCRAWHRYFQSIQRPLLLLSNLSSWSLRGSYCFGPYAFRSLWHVCRSELHCYLPLFLSFYPLFLSLSLFFSLFHSLFLISSQRSVKLERPSSCASMINIK